MKKIFILTGEPSGDKLAAEAIKELKKSDVNVEYLSVGGQHLKSLGIKSIYDQKDITYIAFTDILLNIFKIKRKINETVKKIIDVLDTKIRPAVARDGGDIKFKSFENGVVRVELQGSCSGCPSSLMTLKQGVQNLLKHYVKEVNSVEAN